MKPNRECPIRLHASVIGNEDRERDDRRGAEGGEYRREHDVLDAEDQHHEGGGEQVVERQTRARAQAPAQHGDGCVGDEEEHQRRDQFAESVQQRNHHEDRAAGQVKHGDPHVLAHDQALDPEEDADDSADAGGDGQNPEVTCHGLGIVPGPGRDSAFERHLRHADGSAFDHHGSSVTP